MAAADFTRRCVMLARLFGTWTGILSLAVLIVSVAIIGSLFYMFFIQPPE